MVDDSKNDGVEVGNRIETSDSAPKDSPTPDDGLVAEVSLDVRLQRRNVLLYSTKWCLIYLAAPILYIGFVQVGLCKRLGASDFVANLPSSAYLMLAAFPMMLAWAVPQVCWLKRVMVVGYVITGLMGAVTAAVLWLPVPDSVRIAVVIAHGAVVACSSGSAWAFEWEFVGRGISESRRSTMFAITFSMGPLCAVVGSLASQLIIQNEVFGRTPANWVQIPYPLNYTILYAATLPLMLCVAVLVSRYTIPLPEKEVARRPFVEGVFGGFGKFISNRLIAFACIAYLLIYSGTMIQNNMVLYTREAIGVAEDTFVGYQLAIRFGCKVFAGVMLGWLLKVTNPRMNLYATSLLVISGVAWLLIVPHFATGLIFLVAFGLNGAGELMGAFFPYYVLGLSPKSQMRRNMAFVMLLSAPVALAPAGYGAVSDRWGLTASFWLALGVMVIGVLLVAVALPAWPRPRREDLQESDLPADASSAAVPS